MSSPSSSPTIVAAAWSFGHHACVDDARDRELAGIRASLARGEYLEAFDRASIASDAHPDDLEILYHAVLALARAGAALRARQLLVPLAEAATTREMPEHLAEDIAALEARLAKDRALAAPPDERRRLARRAAELYEAIYVRLRRPYTCINAATMWLMAGDIDRAGELAAAARALVRELTEAGQDGCDYWLAATDAEAAILLGDLDAADRALARAAELADGDLASLATTRRQLDMVCRELGRDTAVLDRIGPPRVIHYCGHMSSPAGVPGRFPHDAEPKVATEIAGSIAGVGFAFGSLACGADILWAEALIDRGAELHVHLPCDASDFVAASVEVGGPGWRERFERCLAGATSVVVTTPGGLLGDDELFAYCSRVAMGHAVIRADFLAAVPEQLAVWDGEPPLGVAGTAADVSAWARTGYVSHVIATGGVGPPPTGGSAEHSSRVVRAMLFADLRGFARLADAQLPSFLDTVMAPLAAAIDRFDDSVLFRNTWGDGIYLVFADVVSAASCALAMQATVERVDLAAAGLPADLAMRVAMHAGPVLERVDPVRGTLGFYGLEVTRAARMEPRTPEGAVYVTDQFAALLALEPDAETSCQYVGRLPSAKDFGTFPMYVLTADRSRETSISPRRVRGARSPRAPRGPR
jgi:hypothetical protein